jgi:hypothetical protein
MFLVAYYLLAPTLCRLFPPQLKLPCVFPSTLALKWQTQFVDSYHKGCARVLSLFDFGIPCSGCKLKLALAFVETLAALGKKSKASGSAFFYV